MIDEISQLKNYNSRLTTVLNELTILEDGVDAEDYIDVVENIGYYTKWLEQRRERLQKRGRHL